MRTQQPTQNTIRLNQLNDLIERVNVLETTIKNEPERFIELTRRLYDDMPKKIKSDINIDYDMILEGDIVKRKLNFIDMRTGFCIKTIQYDEVLEMELD